MKDEELLVNFLKILASIEDRVSKLPNPNAEQKELLSPVNRGIDEGISRLTDGKVN